VPAAPAPAKTPIKATAGAKEEKPEKPDLPDKPSGGGGEVVRLDRFRKK
jgi:hypothetical protein